MRFAHQLEQHDLAPTIPGVEHRLHLRGVPSHHDVGQQAERIGYRCISLARRACA